MVLTMAVITSLLLILSTLALVGSAYYSDKNYKLGKFLWKTSIVTGFFYSMSILATLGMMIYSILDILF